MNFNLLNGGILTITSYLEPSIGWLATAIGWLITAFGSIGLGVIMFTIILKLVTFPLDYVSRAKMRKNSLKMEQMRPQLEKLQKQYANDKAMYQQKINALYKQEGYSIFGACLPTIITLVLFIVVLTGFQDYSKYQNKLYLHNMSKAFDGVVYNGIEVDGEYLKIENDKLYIDSNGLYEIYKQGTDTEKVDVDGNKLIIDGKIFVEYSADKVKYYSTNGYVYFIQYANNEKTAYEGDLYPYVVEDNLSLTLLANEGNNFLKVDGLTFSEWKGTDTEKTADKFILEIQQEKSAESFRNENEGFFWVKNIWQPDSAFAHPVSSTYEDFSKLYGVNENQPNFTKYNELTAKLAEEKGQVNGYFILVLLNVLTAWALQFISSKAQKAQMELQSVDGQGAMSQKVMMWMMPLMMGAFAIYYTAAFSLYIVISSLYSILSTMLINKLVDIKFAKDLKKKELSKDKRYRK